MANQSTIREANKRNSSSNSFCPFLRVGIFHLLTRVSLKHFAFLSFQNCWRFMYALLNCLGKTLTSDYQTASNDPETVTNDHPRELSVQTAGLWAETWTHDLPHKEQFCPFDRQLPWYGYQRCPKLGMTGNSCTKIKYNTKDPTQKRPASRSENDNEAL
jgi:hypothetical protein